MSKTRKSIFLLLLLVFCFSVCGFVFTACGTKSYTVTFLVQNDDTGVWEQYKTADSEDGKVTLPSNPTKEYYIFRNWYENEQFTGDPFTGENVTENKSVYAYFAPVEVSINVTKNPDEADSETVYIKDLTSLKAQYEAEALEAELTFDGWYTGSDYATLWSSSADVDTVYGRFMAQISYDNGYESYEPFKVQAGSVIEQPTLEYIQKSYMDEEDIFYVDENGDDIDFSQPVTKNMNITVLWKTPYLRYQTNPNGTYTVNGYSLDWQEIQYIWNEYPVISLPSRITETDDGGNKVEKTVESVLMNLAFSNYYLDSVKKVIVNEGIKWIYGLSDSSTVEEVVLPSTLKGMEYALNGLTNLSSLTIPEGVEVIIDSLWYSRTINLSLAYVTDTTPVGYDFEIEIPASVKNMAMVPASNFTFASGSPFYIENNALYLKKSATDIVLINSFNVVDRALHVEDFVTGIQVGAFVYNQGTDYVYIPSSVTYMNYNENKSDYMYEMSTLVSNANSRSICGTYLVYEGDWSNESEKMKNGAYMLFYRLSVDNSIKKFIFDTNAYPETLEEDAICVYVSSTNIYSWKTFESLNYVVFTGSVEDEEPVGVYISATNTSINETKTITVTDKVSGDALTTDWLTNLIIDNENTDLLHITSVKQFGRDYTFETIGGNVYLDVEYVYDVAGFTYEIKDGEAVVTGLDTDTAVRLDSGYYFVIITATVTENGVTYPVTEIQEKAFYQNAALEQIIISGSVKTIGESAFEDCTNLTSVTLQSGSLEYVGDHAFEDTALTTIALPLANVTYIGPYAFKSSTLQYFTALDEGTTVVQSDLTNSTISMESGKYYLFDGLYPGANTLRTIIKYNGLSGVEKSATYSDHDNKTVDVLVYDVQLIAIAGGAKISNFSLGASIRANASYKVGTYYDTVFRYEVMEGSVYYLNNCSTGIVFGIISKIHTNAFTDMDAKYTTQNASTGKYQRGIYWYFRERSNTDAYDCWLTQAQIYGISSASYDFTAADAIFEDGWWEGITVDNAEYETLMAFMGQDYLLNTNTALNFYQLYLV